MAINSTLRADDSIHAVIDPFEGVMYLEDWEPQTPFARLQFPQTTSASQSAVNLTQFIDILDMNAFTVFNTWVLANETLRVTVEGDTRLKVNGISRKYPVRFKKVVELKGLNNFNGITVPESRVQLTPDENGDNFFGTVAIPNVSLLTFDIVRCVLAIKPSERSEECRNKELDADKVEKKCRATQPLSITSRARTLGACLSTTWWCARASTTSPCTPTSRRRRSCR